MTAPVRIVMLLGMAAGASLKITLPADLEDFVASRVASGSYRSVTEVIQESLRFLEQHEALLEIPAAELRARIAVGLEQADRGELLDGEEVFRKLEARIASVDSAT